MLIINPIRTEYGRLILPSNLPILLDKYTISHKYEDLSYELYSPDNIRYLFITGNNEEEQELPLWTLPYVYNSYDRKPCIAIDFRQYVKQLDKNNPYGKVNILDISRDNSSVYFMFSYTLILTELLNQNTTIFDRFYNTICLSYANIIANSVNVIVGLTQLEKIDLLIGLSYYSLLHLNDDIDPKNIEEKIFPKLSRMKFGIPVGNKVLVNTIENLLDIRDNSIDNLVLVIKRMLPEGKSDLITKEILLSSLNNIWYGVGKTDAMLVALQDMCLFTTLVYNSLSDRNYKKSRMYNILNMSLKLLTPTDFLNYITKLLKNNIII